MRNAHLVAAQESDGCADAMNRRAGGAVLLQAKAKFFLHAAAESDNDVAGFALVDHFDQHIIGNDGGGVFRGNVAVGGLTGKPCDLSQ